ncbi:transcription repressor OFP12-like [Cornus florida]|uniref:transcription repressor OFP12-like n=1 Tax=Cornus florida TaxID=4283 RepID=UPI00289A004A|nr:transcription repressor OFP12-like [Cornus florida]
MACTTLGRNLNFCFTRIRRSSSAESSRAPHIPEDHSRPLPKYSSNNTAPTHINHFNSLFDLTFDSPESDTEPTTPDFATVFASQRLFFSSPGRSNSIIESPPSSPSSSTGNQPESDTLVGGGIAISTYSRNPYKDFRRSMQEMVEARDLTVGANWDYLHELLLCYLALNATSTHNCIIRAFSDVVVSLVLSQAAGGGRESEFSGTGCSISAP